MIYGGTQHNNLGVARPDVDEETSLEVQTQDAAYHYIKCNDKTMEQDTLGQKTFLCM